MARNGAVWAIDIGQCALKALRCRAHDENDKKVLAEAFDYIEYPKILSQAGADPGELVSDALSQFLSRNTVRGDRVAISVSGQSGLARFVKLPPVEAKKIPDIIRYEARQQIPFDLNDVIWDYQRMGGGSEEEGFALETEIGLFAMKREAVFRTLDPFQKAGIEVDFVQLTPLALYNSMLFDQLRDLPPADEYDPENPPESIIILSLGTDATDLVVTNGFRVWQRSVPIGGNHFTKALTKELKLTFAKAEHLKRNAAAAQDPKAVFQAMRPVFNDLLTELQRSIGYFTSLDRAAKISHVLTLGNAMKLPGLRRYLAQSLGYDVRRVEEFGGLVGSQVVGAPAFRNNVLSFGVCYGLALQGLGKSGLQTNLLPKEIVSDRLVRQKKPWAIAAAAALMLACGLSFAKFSVSLADVDAKDPRWKRAETQANQVAGDARRHVSDADEAQKKLDATAKVGQHLVQNVENRIRWLELLRVLNQCLPSEPEAHDDEAPQTSEGPRLEEGPRPAEDPKAIDPKAIDPKAIDPKDPKAIDPKAIVERISKRNELHITNIECCWMQDVSTWHSAVKRQKWYRPPGPEGPVGPAAPSVPGGTPAAWEPEKEPSGEGWIIMITGHHYHNPDSQDELYGPEFVKQTLVRNLRTATVDLPGADPRETVPITTKDLGISHPVLIDPQVVGSRDLVIPTGASGGQSGVNPAMLGRDTSETTVIIQRFDFLVHFCWQPKLPSEREKPQAEPTDPQGAPD